MEKSERFTLIILAALIITSGLAFYQRNRFIELEQKYLELFEQYESQSIELGNLQIQFNEAEELLHQYNISLTSLDSNPIVKATNIIISQVGLYYFNQYFHDPTVQVPDWNPNVTHVNFKYHIKVGNYTTEQDVDFYFYPKFDRVFGVPIEENMQPFTVTAEEAKQLAIDAGLSDGPYPLDAYIQYTGPGDVFPLTGDEDKYIWRIISWDDPPWANPRKRHSAHVDPVSGEVYPIHEGGRTYIVETVDTPEKALPMGIEGYVMFHYSELPQIITLAGSENLTYTIQASYISYVENRTEVKVTFDPTYSNPYWIHGRTSETLREYLTYEPSGAFTLKVGETLNITCTLSVPESVTELSFNRHALHGIGIGTENTLIVHDLDS